MVADSFLPSYLRDSPLYKDNKRLYSRVPLPTHWNPADSSSYVAIIDDKNLTVKYDGPGRNWVDAASIRANHPIHPEIGLYYYEMTIIDRGDRGCIGIGLSKPATRLNRMPGTQTKDKIMGEMYPMCGMESPNESVTVNFVEGINTTTPIANPSGNEIITHNTNTDVAPDPETTPVIRAIAETQMNASDTNIINTMTSTPPDLGNVVSSNVPVDSTYSTTTL
ncbi:443_t:CDS:2 [Racocetra persica]|uniref:443_t:CDS:1 n=1 Tax=Racocetra persica TaxID=160502 RepID=A0ACA9LGT3_9GLOM|nr:443_t:CDS:2 [Racocetra persica]